MASPTVKNSGSDATVISGTSLSVAWPSHATDDLGICYFFTVGGSSDFDASSARPSATGWTEVTGARREQDGDQSISQWVFYRVAASSSESNASFSWSSAGTTYRHHAKIQTFDGADTTSPIEGAAVESGTTNSTCDIPTPESGSATGDERLGICYGAIPELYNQQQNPANWDEIYEQRTFLSGNAAGGFCGYYTVGDVDNGNTAPRETGWSANDSGAGTDYCSCSMLVKPPSTGGTTHELQATLGSEAALTGDLTIDKQLSAPMGVGASLTANLSVDRALSASLNAEIAFDGSITAERSLGSSLNAGASLDGDVIVEKPLSASMGAGTSLTANLTVDKILSASLGAEIALDGPVTVERSLSSSLNAGASLDGGVEVEKPLTGSLGAGISLDGTLPGDIQLKSSLGAGASLTATLTVDKSLSAPLYAGASLDGGVEVEKPLAGSLGAGISLDGTLPPGIPLKAILGVGASLTATLTVDKSLSAPLYAGASLDGTITSENPLFDLLEEKMSLLTICQYASDELDIGTRPSSIIGNSGVEERKLLRFVKKAVNSLINAADWDDITCDGSYTALGQNEQTDFFPSDYVRLVPESLMNTTQNIPYEKKMSEPEFRRAKMNGFNTGYGYRISKTSVWLETAPTAGDTLEYSYVSKNAIVTTGGAYQDDFDDDTNITVFDDELVVLRTIYEFRAAENSPMTGTALRNFNEYYRTFYHKDKPKMMGGDIFNRHRRSNIKYGY